MDSIQFQGPNKFEVVKVPVPSVGDNDILIKVSCCGICGSDSHFLSGAASQFAPFPLHPGHEVVGVIAGIGKLVTGFSEGERCVVDPIVSCKRCFFCRRSQGHLCENLRVVGLDPSLSGGFSEYIAVPITQVHKIFNLTDEEAALVEPLSCAVHGVDLLNLPSGSDALVLGAGPSGLMFAQILKYNGAAKVVLASNKGVKMDTAKKLNMADEYIELDRNDSEGQWAQIRAKYPQGFDAVVEVTGAKQVLEVAPTFVRKGGALLLYALHEPETRITGWNPAYILSNEIRIQSVFAQSNCFSRAIAYIDSGKINVKGIVTHTYSLQEFQQAVDALSNKEALKIIVRPH
ncbi:NADP+-dependent D-mannitol dehydrogenase [Mycena floridula]|nr:NADP+-dependent D-mannitol dehydrogenase [Mycena floridula]